MDFLAIGERRECDRIALYSTPAMAARHPRDLNVFNMRMPFDGRFEDSGHALGDGGAFVDPWEGAEPAWRELDDLHFALWHIKYNLCDGDAAGFAYTMQHSFFHWQTRRKPGVLVFYQGRPGTGKSALFGENQNGPGLYMRIYGERLAHKYNDVDQLLCGFNKSAMGKSYCVLEEVDPGRGGRNNNMLKDLITEGKVSITPKGVDSFSVNDHHMYIALSRSLM